MNLTIYDNDTLERITFIEDFIYVNYEEKFNGIGRFHIQLPINSESIPLLKHGNYIHFENDNMGVIDFIYKDDYENISVIELRGSMINELLSYRVLETTYILNDDIVKIIRYLVDRLFISNSDTRRRSDKIRLEKEYELSGQVINIQRTGRQLHLVIENLNDILTYGYKLVPVFKDSGRYIDYFEFRIKKPTYRTYEAKSKSPVVFSKKHNNVYNVKYTSDNREFRNLAYVFGTGEGFQRRSQIVGDTTKTGLHRVELYVDARDISEEDENRNPIPLNRYNEMLRVRGNEKLKERMLFKSVGATLISKGVKFEFNKDFFIGDYINVIVDELDIILEAQITATQHSRTRNGDFIDFILGFEKPDIKDLLERGDII